MAVKCLLSMNAHTHTHTCKRMCMCTHACAHIHTHTQMCVCLFVCVCVCVCASVCGCVNIYYYVQFYKWLCLAIISELSFAFWPHHLKVTWVSWAEVKSQLSMRSWRQCTCSERGKRDCSAFLSHISVTVASGDILYEWAVQCMCTYCWSDSPSFFFFFLPAILPIPAIWHQCYFLSATLLGLGLGSQVFASELCQLKTTSKSDEKSCFTSSPVLPHALVSLAILPWSSAPNLPNKQRGVGQGQETLTGQGQETLTGQGQETLTGRGQETLTGQGQDKDRKHWLDKDRKHSASASSAIGSRWKPKANRDADQQVILFGH